MPTALTRSVAVIAAAALPGCFLPVATGTPQPASTVGTGKFAVAVSEEAPTLNLTANDTDFTDSYAGAPAGAGKLEVAYGIAEHTDVEASLEMSFYLFFLPMPVGGSVGIRQQLVDSPRWDVGVAGRIGGVRASADNSDAQKDSASAELVQVSATAQAVLGRFRPLVSIAGIGARMTRNVDAATQQFNGVAGSATLGLMFQLGPVQLGPYLTGTYFKSEEFTGRPFASGGVLVEIRRDRHQLE